MGLHYRQARSRSELEYILELQRKNLPDKLSPQEKLTEGFVTVSHTLHLLERMNTRCGHVIAMDGTRLAGYALCMHPDFANDIPVLKPMFLRIAPLLPVDCRFIVMGQVCVDRAYRKKGVFRGLYSHMQSFLQDEYDLIITEVDATNTRSLGAHTAVGFSGLCSYTSGGHNWEVIQLPTLLPPAHMP